MRFSPIQTELAQSLCEQYEMPVDVSTGVLIDEQGAHKESAAILRQLPYLGFPYNILGPVALMIPACIRDGAYRMFARNRGTIWRCVKTMTGLGETHMHAYRGRIIFDLGRKPDPSWGFDEGGVRTKKL